MDELEKKYDSHPSPRERIKYIENLRRPYSPMLDNHRPALQLFPNPEALQREMTSQIIRNLRK